MNIPTIITAILIALSVAMGSISAYGAYSAGPADSLRLALARADRDERPAALYALCKYFAQTDLDSARHYAGLSLRAAGDVGDSLSMAKAYRARGLMQMYLERMEPAIADMKRGLAIAKRHATPEEPIDLFLLNDLGAIYYYMDRIDLAMDYWLQYLSGVEDRDNGRNKNIMIVALNNIGVFYIQLEDYRSALNYFRRALREAQALDDRDNTLLLQVNIAQCQSMLGNYDSAFVLLRQVLIDCADGTCSPGTMASVHLGLGNVHFLTGSYTNAKQELGLVLGIDNIGTARFRTVALRLLAQIALKAGHPARAVGLLDEAQRLAGEERLRLENMHIHHAYALAYEALGNPVRAMANWKRYAQLYDEIYPKDLINTIARLQARYEEKKNLNRIANQEKMLKLGLEKQAEGKRWIAVVATACAGTLVVIAIIARLYYRKRKDHEDMCEQNGILEADKQTLNADKQTLEVDKQKLNMDNQTLEADKQQLNVKLIDRNEKLDEAVGIAERTNDELKHLMHKISHDIRGPIATIQGLCNLGATESTGKLEEYFTLTNGKALILDSILTRLSRTVEISNTELKIVDIDLLEIVKRAWKRVCEQREVDESQIMPENMKIICKIKKGTTVRSSDEMVYTILENVLDNTVKFCNTSRAEAPFVKVTATQDESHTTIKVLDNGAGIPEEARKKVFMLFVRGSSVYDNTGGMGLYLATIAARQINTTMKLGEDKNGNTEMTIKIPKEFIPNQLYFRGKKVATWMQKAEKKEQKAASKQKGVNPAR